MLPRRPACRRRLGRRRRPPGPSDAGTIQAVLPRRTKFSRKTAWQATEEQVLAANVDVVLIVTSLNEDLNLRRLERYLILAWESGAQPVSCSRRRPRRRRRGAGRRRSRRSASACPSTRSRASPGAGLSTTSARILEPGVTGALLGSSGVGKSTLVNALVGEELLATQEIRDDGQRPAHDDTPRARPASRRRAR